jgi:hypothetical protein
MINLNRYGLSFTLFACSLVHCFKIPSLHNQFCTSLFAKKNWAPPSSNPITGGFSPISTLPQAQANGGLTYTIQLTKQSGISWGSDLSFRWIYVLDMEQAGEASASQKIERVCIKIYAM